LFCQAWCTRSSIRIGRYNRSVDRGTAIGYTGYDSGSSHPPPGAEGLVVITGLLPPAGHLR